MIRAVSYNIASIEAFVKHKYRSSLSIPLTNFLIFSIFHSFEKSFSGGINYAKAKLCF